MPIERCFLVPLSCRQAILYPCHYRVLSPCPYTALPAFGYFPALVAFPSSRCIHKMMVWNLSECAKKEVRMFSPISFYSALNLCLLYQPIYDGSSAPL